MDIVVKVKEVKGSCPTFKVGDSFILKAGYQLVSDGKPDCILEIAPSFVLEKDDIKAKLNQIPTIEPKDVLYLE
jgi:uncharacterized repeat protein (TIGR04076 family)